MATDSDTRDVHVRAVDEVDLVAFNTEAVRTSIDLVAHVTRADLSKPTPCADWTLHGLLTHMIAQHYGFAAAARGDQDPVLWKPRPLGDDPAADYRAAAEHVIAAFAEDGVLDREFPLPEFSRRYLFPGAQAISFHFIDYVVHSWDVARTLGRAVTFDDELLKAALQVAEAVPGGTVRLTPGSAFAPEVEWSGASGLDGIVAMLGRSPAWPQ
ncbi:TIGR03086 family metal-binding protein [Nocardia australiensis]|uniref:TIGR03086 family metal-binding protein n=1 Tax=Nocardia australiensis TaxID=2887191 RepID=UPI001D1409CA|nr:TIGR03086 family metal-binding protein [Nocardia australiensis]